MKRIFTFIISKKKSWVPYFFEFLLLFLAIYLGFLTENYRENQENKQQVKQYLNGIILDVKLDQKLASEVAEDFEMRLPYFDSTVNNFHSIMNGTFIEYRKHQNFINQWADFYVTTSSYEQLKNGGFRLIKEASIIDSINFYYQSMNDVVGETDNLRRHFHKMWEAKQAWLNTYLIDSISVTNPEGLVKLKTRKCILPNQENYVSEYYNYVKIVRGNLKGLIVQHRKQYEKGNSLITFLKEKLQHY